MNSNVTDMGAEAEDDVPKKPLPFSSINRTATVVPRINIRI